MLQGINEVAWMTFIMAIVPFIVQAAVIGVATLQNRAPEPVFPRWFGYLNLWVAVIFVPGGLLTFFKTGPFDWRGLFALWIPFAAFASWIFARSYAVDRAVVQEAREPSGPAARDAELMLHPAESIS